MEELFHFVINTAGIGGLIVMAVLGGATVIYVALTRWILRGGDGDAVAERRLPRSFGGEGQ